MHLPLDPPPPSANLRENRTRWLLPGRGLIRGLFIKSKISSVYALFHAELVVNSKTHIFTTIYLATVGPPSRRDFFTLFQIVNT